MCASNAEKCRGDSRRDAPRGGARRRVLPVAGIEVPALGLAARAELTEAEKERARSKRKKKKHFLS